MLCGYRAGNSLLNDPAPVDRKACGTDLKDLVLCGLVCSANAAVGEDSAHTTPYVRNGCTNYPACSKKRQPNFRTWCWRMSVNGPFWTQHLKPAVQARTVATMRSNHAVATQAVGKPMQRTEQRASPPGICRTQGGALKAQPLTISSRPPTGGHATFRVGTATLESAIQI